LTISRGGTGLSTAEAAFSGQGLPESRPQSTVLSAVCTAIWKNRDSYPSNTGIVEQNGGIDVMDDTTRTELEAAVFRRLVEHLRTRSDVQNIDLMNLAGFCRNCLSNWLKEEADAKGTAMSKDESREAVYGMPYETWKSTYQGTASPEQLAAMKKAQTGH
jgi:uncharacterized protein